MQRHPLHFYLGLLYNFLRQEKKAEVIMTTEIRICMGSSCFARGNSDNLEFIENYIKENNLDAKVEVYGARCDNICDKGPNIIINDKVINNVNQELILEELRKLS